MVNKSKNLGTQAESAVVRAARTRGFPGAERRALAGAADRGDILLAPGLIAEVKGGQAAKTASDAQIATWLAQTETERVHAGADVAILVTARAGIGAPNAHRWHAHLRLTDFLRLLGGLGGVDLPDPHTPVRTTLDDALTLLRAAGYGEPIGDPERPQVGSRAGGAA